jgi:tyrosinase
MKRYAIAKGVFSAMDRRTFMLASTATLAACSSPNAAFPPGSFAPAAGRRLANAKTLQRLEIAEFSANPKLVASLRAGVAAMRAVKNPRNVASWNYWHYSHWMPKSNPPPDMLAVWDQCKHGESYFQPWHRGFLHFFEMQLRAASGNPALTLPYWDYYKNPKLPEIFTAPTLSDGSANPLYWPNRTGTVIQGLNFLAFADTVTTFPWGPGETFEDLSEKNPHNRVHNQVGGSMGDVPTAPADPIFWIHHCNIDRLWSAWVATGKGRKMPEPGALWWRETFEYNLDGSWNARVADMDDTRNLGYYYRDLSLPVARRGETLPARPPVIATGATNQAGPIRLNLEPVTVAIPLGARVREGAFDVVLHGVSLSELGKQGGFDYSIFANLPDQRTPLAQEGHYEIGEFGSFDLSMPAMQGMPVMAGTGKTLRVPLSEALVRQAAAGVPEDGTLMLSFVAYGAPNGVSKTADLAHIERITVAPR